MARFNPEIQTDLGGNLTNRSQGSESSLKAVGMLFEGLGQTFGNYVNARDREIRDDISRSADAGVNQELGSILGGDPQTENNANVPSEISGAAAKMARYKSAYDQGKLSDLYFYGQVGNISKSLRSKYPGYADIVDDAISNAIGTNPANRIRQELLQGFGADAEKMSQSEKWWRDTIRSNIDVVGALGIDPSQIDFNNPQQLNEVYKKISIYKGGQEAINTEKAKLELQNAQDAGTKRQAKQTATNDLNFKMRTWFNKDMNPVWAQYQAAYGNALQDKKLSPEERTQLSQLFSQFKAQVSLNVDRFMIQPDEKGFSYSSYLDKSERADVKDIALSQVDIYEKLLTDQNFGLFNLVANENKAAQDGYENKVITGEYGDTLANLKLLMSTGVDLNVINDMMTTIYGDAGWASMKEQLAAQTLGLSGMSGSNENIGDSYQRLRNRDGTLSPTFYDKSTQQFSDLLSIPGQQPQIIKNAARALYKTGDDDKLLKQFGGTSRNQVFLRLTRPEITANLKGTEEFDSYSQWAQKQFSVIGRNAVNDILANNQVAKWIDIQYDPGKSQFKYTITPSVVLQGIGRGGNVSGQIRRNNPADQPVAFSADAQSLKKVSQSIDFLNMYAGRLKEISEAGNMDANETLKYLYQGLRISPDALNENTVVGKMFQSLMSADAEGDPPQADKPGDQGNAEGEPKAFASFVSSAEGAKTGTMFGGANLPLDKMTVAEVQSLQKSWARATGSSAAGKYQVMQDTLRGLIEDGTISPDALFDDATQEQIFSALLNRRGLADYKSGKITREQFAGNLSQEWASLPKDAGGASFYQGDKMGNKATVSWRSFLKAMDTL